LGRRGEAAIERLLKSARRPKLRIEKLEPPQFS
jgi:hypothetical protein